MAADSTIAPADAARSLDLAQGLAATARTFDTVVHERTRLAILSALSAARSMSFRELKSLLGVTDGNLSVHARKLEAAGYIAVRKGFRGRQPRTTFALTREGRQALEAYLRHMEALISAIGRIGRGRADGPAAGAGDDSGGYPLPASAVGGS
ncbi:MAG: transcriptional regulator [Spirochaetaceae bacterium]|nr:transcriptional regulator [Spirochaetaceae bacterium]